MYVFFRHRSILRHNLCAAFTFHFPIIIIDVVTAVVVILRHHNTNSSTAELHNIYKIYIHNTDITAAVVRAFHGRRVCHAILWREKKPFCPIIISLFSFYIITENIITWKHKIFYIYIYTYYVYTYTHYIHTKTKQWMRRGHSRPNNNKQPNRMGILYYE